LQHQPSDHEVLRAGNSFTLDPEVKTSPLLSDSWFRSQRYGLDPATDDFPRLGSGELADALASHARLQQLTQPVVNTLSRKVSDLQSVVILSDASGLVLQTFGNMHAMQKAQSFALAPGNLWSESGRGPTPSAPRWPLTTAAKSTAASTFSPAIRIFIAPRCRSRVRTEKLPGCWIFPARPTSPSPHAGVGQRGREAD
jgi:hypothetical protein